MVHGTINVGHILNDQRVVTTHLQCQDFLRLATKLLVQQMPDRGTAGKEQAINPRVASQGFARCRSPLHKINYTVGDTGLLPEFDRQFGDSRGQLTRLEHNRVTGQQSRHYVAIRQMPRKVVGAEHRHHPVGPVSEHCVTTGNIGLRRPCTVVVGFHGNADLADHRRHFRAGFPQRLARLQANLVCQLILVSLKQLTKGFNNGLTFGKALALPLHKGISGLTNGRINILQVRAFAIPDCFTRHRLDRFKYRPMAR